MKKKLWISAWIIIIVMIGIIIYQVQTEKNSETLSTYINKTAKENGFNGTILVSKKGKIAYEKGFGYQDKSKGIKNSVNTVYSVASLTKSFTAIGILQLEEQGKLKVNEPLSDFIKGFPDGNKITLHDLLTHQSGIVEILNVVNNTKPLTPNDIIEILKKQRLQFTPGKKFSYSDSNYSILAYIIEKLSGMSYHDYIKKNIFQKVGMNHSSFLSDSPKNLAIGYEKMEKPDTVVHNSLVYGSGDITSTVEDLKKYNEAVNHYLLLNKKETEKMQTGYVQNLPNESSTYGYGWIMSKDINHRNIVQHSGFLPGFRSIFTRYIQDDTSIIMLTNDDKSPDLEKMENGIASILYIQKKNR